MFREKDIRPGIKERIMNALYKQDIKAHFLNEKGAIIRNYFIEVHCPACGKKDNPKEFTKEKFNFKRCNRCNTLYVSPRPKTFKLIQYYQYSRSISYFIKDILEKTAKIRKEKIFKIRAKEIITHICKLGVPKEVLIEVGGGNGIFLEVMREMKAGFKRYINIEPSKEAVLLTQKRGFEVINDSIENVETVHADCVCAFELIEHVFDPFSFCKKINGILRKNGVFILTCPNIEGLDLLILGKDSDNITAPNHLNYFNPRSISMLLKRAGFRTISIETPGALDVDILRNKLTEGCYIADRFISLLLKKSQKVLNNFQNFLQLNELSSNMFILSKKI